MADLGKTFGHIVCTSILGQHIQPLLKHKWLWKNTALLTPRFQVLKGEEQVFISSINCILSRKVVTFLRELPLTAVLKHVFWFCPLWLLNGKWMKFHTDLTVFFFHFGERRLNPKSFPISETKSSNPSVSQETFCYLENGFYISQFMEHPSLNFTYLVYIQCSILH